MPLRTGAWGDERSCRGAEDPLRPGVAWRTEKTTAQSGPRPERGRGQEPNGLNVVLDGEGGDWLTGPVMNEQDEGSPGEVGEGGGCVVIAHFG